MIFNVSPSVNDIKLFFDSNSVNQEKFRYFKKRNFDVIKNHIKTILLINENKTIGYGHLDSENDNIWLGIIVCDECKGLGYGSLIMDKLIDNFNKDIILSVDKDNISAMNLYIKKGFYFLSEHENYYKMIKKI